MARRARLPAVVERTLQWREPRRYLGAPRVAERRIIGPADLPFEFMMNALRLNEGFEQREFGERTGLSFHWVRPTLQRLTGRGLVEHAGSRWRATSRGLAFLNELLTEFLPQAPQYCGKCPSYSGNSPAPRRWRGSRWLLCTAQSATRKLAYYVSFHSICTIMQH